MNDITEYVKNELCTFSEKPFSDLDSVCLSQMAYLFYDGLVGGVEEHKKGVLLYELYRAEYFSGIFRDVANTENDRQLFTAMAASPRFRNIKLNFYVNDLDLESEKQFAAVTFQLTPRLFYVAFRGTDWSITGWKEDLNLACKTPVPAQAAAAKYLNDVAARVRGKLIVGGHSKGGNLAVYAASTCDRDVFTRIVKVYSHDGPGFGGEFIKTEGYAAIRPQIVKIVPQGSIVGMMLEKDSIMTVVESDGTGIMQHSPFTWRVKDGAFMQRRALSSQAKYVNGVTNSWIDSLSAEKKEEYVEALFVLMKTSGMTPLDFSVLKIDDLPAVLAKLKTLSPDARESLKELFATLTSSSFKNLRTKRKNG